MEKISTLQNNNAAKHFRKLKKHVTQVGIPMTEIVVSELAILANARDNYDRYARFCNEKNEIIDNTIRPEFWEMEKACKVMLRYETRYGLTPASYNRVKRKLERERRAAKHLKIVK